MAELKERLKGKISESKLELVKRSFDVIGDIAVLEIPEEIKGKEKTIAKAVMELYPRVKVVAKKTGATSGVERIRPVKVIAGEKRTETIYIENGCRFRLDINKVYFSPRLGSERLRVAEQVKKNDIVYDMFCGVGPYAIPCAKRGKRVVAVDINKNAVGYVKENMKLNKVENIEAYTGSCRKVLMKKEHRAKADRVIMNHPSGAEEFLDVAFYAAKKGAKIYYYTFTPEEEIYVSGVEAIKAAAKKLKKKIRILKKKKCGQYAPRVWRVCIEFKLI